MLGEDEIRHIFPDEEAEEITAGDVVSALWLPNGQFYDAKVLQKGGKFHFTMVISATRSQGLRSLRSNHFVPPNSHFVPKVKLAIKNAPYPKNYFCKY